NQARAFLVGTALDTGKAGQRLDERVINRLLGERTFFAEAADRYVDDVGGERADGGLAEPHAIDHAAPEVLNEDVGRGDQLAEDRGALVRLQVEDDGTLAAVVVEERGREAGPAIGRRAG